MDRTQLTLEVRQAFRRTLFDRVLEDSLNGELRTELAATTLPLSFVRERCRKDLADTANVALEPIDGALFHLAAARSGRKGTGRLVYDWVFTRGWRLLSLVIAMAAWTGAFALADPGSHGTGSPRPVMLWTAAALIALILMAMAVRRGDEKDLPAFLVQVLAVVTFPSVLLFSTVDVSPDVRRQTATTAFALLLVAGYTAVTTGSVLTAHARSESFQVRRVLGLSTVTVAVLAGSLLPLAVLLLFLNLGDTPQRIDVSVPYPLLVFPALTLQLTDILIGLLGRDLVRITDAEKSYRQERGAALERLRESVVEPYLRQMISEDQPSFETTLAVARPGGLSQSFDPLYEIPTSATRRLRALIDAMPGGSVGVAGPRGVGKSTVLGSLCERARPEPGLRLLVSAPVEYSPREFLLHLYAQVCREALTWHIDGGEPPDPIDSVLSARSDVVSYVVSGLIGGGALLIFAVTALGYALNNGQILAVILAAAAVALTAQTWSRRPDRKRAPGSPSIEAVARDRINEIEYQQSISGEWSGAIKVPAGLDSTLKRSSGFVRQPKNLPEIVDSLRQFLRMIATAHGGDPDSRLIIGIDELDKIENEGRAQQFLNDIKSIFGVSGWHFLVSVSEDAMASFERRGLPFRDAFDSAFDEIVSIDYLTFQECSDLLSRRTTEIPVPFKGLTFCLSGGLPRDLIRAARQMIAVPDGGSRRRDLSSVARRLVTQDLAGKANAVKAAVCKIDLEPMTSSLIIWCEHATFHVTTPEAMADAVRELARLDVTGGSNEVAALCRLAREIAGYAYYCLTLVEFFSSDSSGERWVRATAKDRRGFDELARTRRALTLNPLVGWDRINRFRTEWRMTTVDAPANLAGAVHSEVPSAPAPIRAA
jgi:hypothetical protein